MNSTAVASVTVVRLAARRWPLAFTVAANRVRAEPTAAAIPGHAWSFTFYISLITQAAAQLDMDGGFRYAATTPGTSRAILTWFLEPNSSPRHCTMHFDGSPSKHAPRGPTGWRCYSVGAFEQRASRAGLWHALHAQLLALARSTHTGG